MRRKSNVTGTRRAPSSLIQGKLDTLTQGVSQQPPHLRLPGQGERQVNAYSSPVEGLTKRAPTMYAGRIFDTFFQDLYSEMMPVVGDENYSVTLTPVGSTTELRILLNGLTCKLDVHGTGMTVNASPYERIVGDSTSYIHHLTDLYKKYVLINNGPLGLLLNREKSTALSSATVAAAKTDAMIFVQGVTYDVSYVVTLAGTALTAVTTPKVTDTNNTISTATVASGLATRINGVSGYTATANGAVVLVSKNDGGAFTLQLDDSRSNTLARVIRGSVSTFSQLPARASNGFIVKIDSEPANAQDDYWVKFVTNDGSSFGEGTWVETLSPGQKYKLDENAMPLVVYRAAKQVFFVGPADGATRSVTHNSITYTYTFPSWGQRTAGDETTVPTPSFVGQQIKDHVLFRGRYAICAGESVVLSETNDIFNFFPDTSVAVLETDPIDLRASSETSTRLNWLLPVNETLLAFSNNSQFQIRPADVDVLTPRTATILRLSNILMNPDLRPKIAGPVVLFATNEFNYTNFREFQFFETQTRRLGLNLGGSLNLTASVPKYIDGLASHWDVGETVDMMVCRTPNDKKKLYVYKYLWQSSTDNLGKSQASWSEWTFDGDIIWVKFIGNELWFLMSYPDGTYSCFMNSEELDQVSKPTIHMDRLLMYPECNSDSTTTNNVAASFNAATNKTTFTLPYQMQGKTTIVTRTDNSGPKMYELGSGTTGTTITCAVPGDWSSSKLAIGRRYKMEYEFTRAFVPARDQARSRVVGEQAGRLQVATWQINHFNTGFYDVVVKRNGRSIDSRYEYRSRALNVLNNTLTTETKFVDTGSFRAPVYSKNLECRVIVESDSYLPVTVTSAIWEGNYNDRSRSVG
ncbi:MAG: hypothetical protein FJ211_09230 [Ignavibacteria bacterium]|nr:hypothetical protein [Ignavibacteria bacterium]